MKAISKKDVEDGLAWLRGEVGLNELARKRKMKHSRNLLPRLAVYIREAYRLDKIV